METRTRTPARVVVGMDLSDGGDQALRDALELRRRFQPAELYLVHVLTPSPMRHGARVDALGATLDVKLTELEARAKAIAAPLHRRWRSFVHCEVRVGEPAAALHQVAVDVDAHMIVVGAHERHGVERMLAGSVAEHLVRIAHLPVLVARRRSLDGLAKSGTIEPPRPASEARPEASSGMIHRAQLGSIARNTHISGLL